MRQREMFAAPDRRPITEPEPIDRWGPAEDRAPCPDCGKRLVCAQCRADIKRVVEAVKAAREVA